MIYFSKYILEYSFQVSTILLTIAIQMERDFLPHIKGKDIILMIGEGYMNAIGQGTRGKKQWYQKITLSFRKTPTDLTIRGGYLGVTLGESYVAGKRERMVRRRLLLKKFSVPTFTTFLFENSSFLFILECVNGSDFRKCFYSF